MKLPLFILLALAALTTERHRIPEARHHTARTDLGIENTDARGYIAACCDHRDGPDDIPAAFLSLRNSILCICFDSRKFMVLEWTRSGHLLVFLKIGRKTYA